MNVRRTALVFALLVCAVPALAEDRPAVPQDLASLVPADTLVLLQTDDLGGLDRRLKDTAVGRILSEPEMRAFVSHLWKQIKTGVENASPVGNPLGFVGLEWEDLEKLRIRRIGLALIAMRPGRDPGNTDVVFTLQFRAGTQKIKKAFLQALQMAEGFGLPMEELGVEGWEGRMIPSRRVQVFAGFKGDRLLVTTTRERFQAIASGLREGLKNSLAATADYQRTLKRLDAARHGTLLYTSAKSLRKMMRLGAGPNEGIAFPFGDIDSVAFVDVPRGSGYRSELALLLNEQKGFFGLLPKGRPSHKFARFVPRDALLYWANKTDLGALADRVVQLAGRGDGGRAEQELAKLGDRLGFDLREDLLRALGTEWAVFLSAPPNGGLLPDVVLMCDLRDKAKVQKSLDVLLAGLEKHLREDRVWMRRRKTSFRGQEIHFLELSRRGDPIPVAPAWTWGDDYLAISLFPQTLKHLQLGRPTLADDPKFKAAMQKVPPHAFFVGYTDTPRFVGWIYNLLVPLGQGVQGALNKKLEPLGVELRLQDLPPAHTITKHLEPSVSFVAHGDDAVRIGTVSSVRGGPVLLTTIGAAAGMVAVLMYAPVAAFAEDGGDAAVPGREVDLAVPDTLRQRLERQARELERLRGTNARLLERLEKMESQIKALEQLIRDLDRDGGKR